MARLIDNKILFIHLAKTGGTFFREAINFAGISNKEVGRKHFGWEQLINLFPPDVWKDLTKVAYIRHPITWYRSRWAFGMMSYFGYKIQYMPEAKDHWMAKVWSEDLNLFVENTLREYPRGIATEYFDEMLGGLDDAHKRLSVLRYENLIHSCAGIIYDLTGNQRILQDLKSMPRFLDSHKIHQEISPVLKAEIEAIEYKVIQLYY